MDVTKKTMKMDTFIGEKGNGDLPEKKIAKEVTMNSFFTYFNPPLVEGEQSDGEMEDEKQAILEIDFEVGINLKKKVIPRAVLYFTGEALNGEDSDDEEDEEEDEEDESEKES